MQINSGIPLSISIFPRSGQRGRGVRQRECGCERVRVRESAGERECVSGRDRTSERQRERVQDSAKERGREGEREGETERERRDRRSLWSLEVTSSVFSDDSKKASNASASSNSSGNKKLSSAHSSWRLFCKDKNMWATNCVRWTKYLTNIGGEQHMWEEGTFEQHSTVRENYSASQMCRGNKTCGRNTNLRVQFVKIPPLTK